jgi:hypothetical protein
VQFDTLDFAKKLEAAGVPVPQAEVHAKALGEALFGAVASKGDMMTLENNFIARLAATEARLDSKIESVRLELGGRVDNLRWITGVIVALNVGILIRLLAL